MTKYKFSVGTHYVGSTVTETIEIPDECIEGLSEEERESAVAETYDEWVQEQLRGGWEEIEE